MPCFKPLQAWRGRERGKSGKQKIVFDKSKSIGIEITLPCGRCIGCRLERSRQWAMRMMHEASLHEENCFITLTYDEEKIPVDGSLVKGDFQKFMKRLRRKNENKKIRFFHCGEYGDKLGRPHYHAVLFGFDFEDKTLFKNLPEGGQLFTSSELDDLWGMGYATVGDVTFESCAYVARYVMKKITGPLAEDYYGGKLPEYTTMSRGGRGDGGGIGGEWYDNFKSDVFPSDTMVVNGVLCKPPRYYGNKYENENPEDWERIRSDRMRKANRRAYDSTPERLRVREICTEERVKRLRRTLDEA